MDVPYRTLWGWINESEENQKKYDEAREEQDEIIRLKIDEVKLYQLRHNTVVISIGGV